MERDRNKGETQKAKKKKMSREDNTQKYLQNYVRIQGQPWRCAVGGDR